DNGSGAAVQPGSSGREGHPRRADGRRRARLHHPTGPATPSHGGGRRRSAPRRGDRPLRQPDSRSRPAEPDGRSRPGDHRRRDRRPEQPGRDDARHPGGGPSPTRDAGRDRRGGGAGRRRRLPDTDDPAATDDGCGRRHALGCRYGGGRPRAPECAGRGHGERLRPPAGRTTARRTGHPDRRRWRGRGRPVHRRPVGLARGDGPRRPGGPRAPGQPGRRRAGAHHGRLGGLGRRPGAGLPRGRTGRQHDGRGGDRGSRHPPALPAVPAGGGFRSRHGQPRTGWRRGRWIRRERL
ncbi:MAG: hypothetical protein AVDCRST_MAG33-2177, partial [uncultured Thermomicrobiales bacterium]